MDAWKRDDPRPGRRPGRRAPGRPGVARRGWRPAAGVLTRLDALAVGIAAWRLGAGRARKEDPVQAGAGVRWHARPGDPVTEGQPLMTLLTDEPDRFERALAALEGAYDIAADASYDRRPDRDRPGGPHDASSSAGESFEIAATGSGWGSAGTRTPGRGRPRPVGPRSTSTPRRCSSPARSCSTWRSTTTSRPATARSTHHGDNQTRQRRGRRRADPGRPGQGARPGRHDPVPGQQLPGPLAGVGRRALLPRLVDDESDEELARFTLTFALKDTGAVLALLRRTPSAGR